MKSVVLLLLFLFSACRGHAEPTAKWLPLNEGLPTHLIVLALMVNAVDSSLLAAAYDSTGVYRSQDGGNTWEPDNVGLASGPVFMLLVAQDAAWAGTRDGLFVRPVTETRWQRVAGMPQVAVYTMYADTSRLYVGTAGRGAFTSGDGGKSWQPIPGLGNETVLSILRVGEMLDVGTSGHGVLATRDGGETWSPIPELAGAFVSFMAQDPRYAQVIYARTRNGLYRSVDGGHLFDRLGAEIQTMVIHTILVDPNRNRIYVGTAANGVLMSDNEGLSWQAGQTPLPEGHAVLALTRRGNTLYAGTVDGVYVSSDAGMNWRRVGLELGVPQLHALVAAADGNMVYAATEDGLYSRAFTGQSWKKIGGQVLDTPVLAIATTPENAQRMIIGTGHHGVLLSGDAGVTWRPARGDLSGKTSVAGVLIDPRDPQTVYARVLYERIYRSTDGGDHWDAMWNGMSRATEVETMAIDPHTTGLIYAGTDEGLYVSTDRGENWSPWGLTGISVLALWLDAAQPGHMLAGATDGLYQSVDGGANWTRLAFENVTVTAIVPDRRGNILAGTDYQGTFISRAGSALQTWDALGEGLADLTLNGLVVDQAHGIVYAATEHGIFKLER